MRGGHLVGRVTAVHLYQSSTTRAHMHLLARGIPPSGQTGRPCPLPRNQDATHSGGVDTCKTLGRATALRPLPPSHCNHPVITWLTTSRPLHLRSCLQACGALFSIAPFVTFRSYPCAMSVISAGGQLGAVLMQGVFFTRQG